jgi:D-glycero-D-manno-heptose 1,7-bisphosphate phosphatase
MPLIILDRDGVINEDSDAYIKSPDELIPIPGSLEAIARLNRAGYTVSVASNQSGLARNYFTRPVLEAMHAKLQGLLQEHDGNIDTFFICPHGPDDDCDCRKPRPGLMRQIERHYGVSLDGVPAIGDSLRDVQAALAAGAKPILVRTGKGADTEADGIGLYNVPIYDNLAAAVNGILDLG